MALIKLGGVAVVCIKHCCFMAVLIGNLKVDWEIADVKTHQESLSPSQADLQPSACTVQEPRRRHPGCLALPKSWNTLQLPQSLPYSG